MSSSLQIQFLGVNEGGDPKSLPPGTLLRADNCQMDKDRRLCKRRGTTGLVKTHVDATTITAGVRLLTNGSDTALNDGVSAHTYVDSISHWVKFDRPPVVGATCRGLADSTRGIDAIDTGIYGNLLFSLYVVSVTGALYWQVDDLTTGAPVIAATMLSASLHTCPRVLVQGTIVYMFASTAGAVTYWERSATDLTSGGTGSLVATARTVPTLFDVVIGTPTAGVPTLYLAYEEQSGTNRTTIASYTLNSFGVAPTAITSAAYLGTGVASICLAFGTASQTVLLHYALAATTKMVTVTTALVAVQGPTTTVSVASQGASCVFIAEDDATNALVGWGFPRPTVSEEFTTELASIAAGAVVAASVRTTYGLCYPSKPWRTAGRWHCSAVVLVHQFPSGSANASPQASSVVVEIETAASLTGTTGSPHVHAATLENQTGWYPGVVGYVTKSSADADGNLYVVAAYRNREPQQWYSTIPIGWNVYTLTLDGQDTGRPASLGAGALCAGGAPYWFDGASTTPYGFAHAPFISEVGNGGAGAMASGTYSYVATYSWRDANGVLHRSAPSAAKSFTTSGGGSQAISVSVHTASLSGRQKASTLAQCANPVFIELWRTIVGGAGNHYRLSLEPVAQVLSNDSRAVLVTLVDTKADASISGGSDPTVLLNSQEVLYTELGEIENEPPPSLITVTTHKGRLVGIGPDLRTVWFSKDSTLDATLAPGFNEALCLAFAHDKTALASLDSSLAVFGEDTIDVVDGNGPGDDGGSNDWQIRPVQTDVGCTNPRSPVSFPGGCIFESRLGLCLLDRSLNVSFFGQSIDDTLTLYPNITSAVLVAEQTEVRFTCDDGETGIVLAYDYLFKLWTVRKYTDASDTTHASVLFADAALINGVYTLLTAGGQVYRETTSHKLDGGTTYVERDILLAPISAQPGRSGWSNDNLGWSRVKDLTLMGTSVTAHDLKVSFAHDYATTFSQTHTFPAGGTVTTPGPLEKGRVTCVQQKCQAVQIRIQDLTPTVGNVGASGDGAIIESLCLRVGALGGPARTSAGQRG